MANIKKRPLKVFLCHASGDKPRVTVLYQRLVSDGIDAWLDKEKLLPGQDWRVEIPRAVQEADVVIVFLSKKSVTKEGYVQKEIKLALDVSDEKPEDTIFLIPARLEACNVPTRLLRWQWVDLFSKNGYLLLLKSLSLRAKKLNIQIGAKKSDQEHNIVTQERPKRQKGLSDGQKSIVLANEKHEITDTAKLNILKLFIETTATKLSLETIAKNLNLTEKVTHLLLDDLTKRDWVKSEPKRAHGSLISYYYEITPKGIEIFEKG